MTAYVHIWWSKLEVSRESTGVLPLTNREEIKIVMCFVFVPDDYELDLWETFHGWKKTFAMHVWKYTEEFQMMITRLDPSDLEEQKCIAIL